MSTEQDLNELFRAERAVRPAATAVDQGWQRLAVDLAANVAPAPVATGALKLGSALIPKWLFLGFAVGMAGVGAAAAFDKAKHQTVSTQPRVVPATLSVRQGPTLATPTQVAPVTPSSQPSAPAVRSATPSLSATPVTSAPSATTFDAELKLISFAKGELDARRFRQARAWLAEHAERFPNGVFAVEREAMGVLADCEQGPKNEALARAFAARHPGSPVSERLERACGPNAGFSKSLNGGAGLGEPITEPSRGDGP
jgi:hypothetical protein